MFKNSFYHITGIEKTLSVLLTVCFISAGCASSGGNSLRAGHEMNGPSHERSVGSLALVSKSRNCDDSCKFSSGFGQYLLEKNVQTIKVDDIFNPHKTVVFGCFRVNDRLLIELSLLYKGVPEISNLYAVKQSTCLKTEATSLYSEIYKDIRKAVNHKPCFIRGTVSGPSTMKEIVSLSSDEKLLDQYKSDEYAMNWAFQAIRRVENQQKNPAGKINAYLDIIEECNRRFGYHLRDGNHDQVSNSYLYHSGFRSELVKKYIYARLYALFQKLGQDSRREMALINYFFCDAYLALPSTRQESRVVREYEMNNRRYTSKYRKARVLKPTSLVAGFALFVPAFVLHAVLDRATLGKASKNPDVIGALNKTAAPTDVMMEYHNTIDEKLSRMFDGLKENLEQAAASLGKIIERTAAMQHSEVREIREKLYQLKKRLNREESEKVLLEEFYAIHQESQKLQKSISAHVPISDGSYGLSVDTDPPGASIRILNIRKPYYPGIRLLPGSYEIEVERDGYLKQLKRIKIENRDKRITVSLEKDPRKKLTIKTNPADARVRFLDIKPGYKDGILLNPGSYKVEVSKPGYHTSIDTVRIAGRNVVRSIRLKKIEKYPLYVETVPSDARIRILNIKPVFKQGMLLPAGSYKLEVSMKGFHTAIRTIMIREKRNSVSMRLEKKGVVEWIKGLWD